MEETGTKEEAILLRKRGSSLKEISEILKISKSTAGLWLREVALSPSARKTLREKQENGRKKGNAAQKEKSVQKVKRIDAIAVQYMNRTPFSQEQAKGMCALLYGCEGTKNGTRVAFINSDPDLIRFFLTLFRIAFTVDEKKFRVVMQLHGYHKERQQLRFWASVTGICEKQFSKTFQKKNGKRNIRDGYQGCISVRYNSADVQRELVSVYREILRRGQKAIR